MTTPEQVEAVARAMCHERHPCWSIVWEIFETDHDGQATEFRNYAAVAINAMRPFIRAEALEEAAKVVTEHYQELCTEHRLLLVNRAAAIRALKEKP
jgi:hypothetical protein